MHLEHLTATTFSQHTWNQMVSAAAERAHVPECPVILSGDFALSVAERLGIPHYDVNHRANALTVARTFCGEDGHAEVVLNYRLLSRDGRRVETEGATGSSSRYLAHEFFHAAVHSRGEPSVRPTHPLATDAAFWLSNAWKLLGELRVERALYAVDWPQDIDFVGELERNLGDFMSVVKDPSADVAGFTTRRMNGLCDRLGHAAATSRLGYSPVWNRHGGTCRYEFLEVLREVPHAGKRSTTGELLDHADRIAHCLEHWYGEATGYRIESPAPGSLLFVADWAATER